MRHDFTKEFIILFRNMFFNTVGIEVNKTLYLRYFKYIIDGIHFFHIHALQVASKVTVKILKFVVRVVMWNYLGGVISGAHS